MITLTPFTKLLIANRGEIAVRVMRTARSMGYRTVAVYSQADTEAEHVRFADEAVCIGGAAPADSYLRIDAILDAAKQTGADAIHPGYGFLAESDAFAAACGAAGLIFVGPDAEAIRNMGDKAVAKELMSAAGVPCVPGYQGADQSVERLLAEARKIGFPVMIKATAGGGGRGMRFVPGAEVFADQLATARSEAKGAFDSDSVLLERAIVNPRHVEVQIMADRYGNVIHLGERDCSVQRRHQKLIEESPSPCVDPDLRARMGQTSVEAAKAIGYIGAGTFEYLLDADGSFYFMEMNTRLQVEHPVTELITGLDLVELQLRVAAGEPLPLSQADISSHGHAMEVRLCAEDPAAGFMPQSGVVDVWEPSPAIRTDHALCNGSKVPAYYDSMIAKLVAHGPSRDDVRRKLVGALGETVVFGLRTNRDFLADCLTHPIFAAGGATTGFIEEHGGALIDIAAAGEAHAAMVAAALMRAGPGNRLTHGYPAPLRLLRGETEYAPRVQVDHDGVTQVCMPDYEPISLRILSIQGSRFVLHLQNVRCEVVFVAGAEAATLQIEGRCYDFRDLTFVPILDAEAVSGDGKVRASMNGSVVSVAAKVGDRVEAGDKLVVIEAMKMEHIHASPVTGTISAVHVETGVQVGTHALLVEIDPS